MGIATWRPLLERMGADMDAIDPGLFARVDAALREVEAAWPATLPVGAIHADLFPDNVLMLGDTVSGLIDFYFACTDVRAYDLAIMHSAWTFDATGRTADAAIGAALLAGYADGAALSAAERAALPLLAQGACIRFLLSRAWDWLHTPADALVMRKDPLAYARRLDWYRTHPGAFA